MPAKYDKKTFDKMTNVVLVSMGTPRNYLFEYPYNEFESRDLIAKAEKVVRDLMRIMDEATS